MSNSRSFAINFLVFLSLYYCASAFGHGISGGDADFIVENQGFNFMIYLYLGAKHMVTGYDHLLFLFGVIFYLTNLRSIALYVSLFAIGHSITLLTGVLADIKLNAFLIDAIIGLSVVYKAFDNIGGFDRFFGAKPDDRVAVFIFGLVHGFGLATKLQEMTIASEGLIANLLSFNLGVEIGQILALLLLLLVLDLGQRFVKNPLSGVFANIILMTCGFALTSYQLAFYLAS